jgi:hypothetical protein
VVFSAILNKIYETLNARIIQRRTEMHGKIVSNLQWIDCRSRNKKWVWGPPFQEGTLKFIPMVKCIQLYRPLLNSGSVSDHSVFGFSF